MLKRLSINLENNIIEDILISLKAEARKKVLLNLKTTLLEKGIATRSGVEVPALAEEHLTVKELKSTILDALHLMPVESEDVRSLKAHYLEQRIRRVSAGNTKLKIIFQQKLTATLLRLSLIEKEEADSWKTLSSKMRHAKVLYYAANHLDYLDLEDIFVNILEPKAHLSEIVKEARNIDAIKNMTNSEILPFLEKLITHEKEIPETDKKEVLETVIDFFISSHQDYIVAATKYFSLADIYKILNKCICLPDRRGKIGQKSAGMILACKILVTEQSGITKRIRMPESYYLTTDVFFECLYPNQYNFSSIKHRLKEGLISEFELEDEYPRIKKLIMETSIPDTIRIQLRKLLMKVGTKPLIVRSSSLLEDSASAFSGKYDSYFFANQPLLDETDQDLELRVDILIEKILMVYASVLSPEALIYRRERGLLDVDERMSILIQTVEGQRYGKYYFPTLSGVGLSHNNRVDTAKIRWNDPILRIGVGLGTGIVDIKGAQVKVVYPGNPDYTTILNFYEILKTSQRHFDVLNLVTDTVDTVTKTELFDYFNKEAKNDKNIQRLIKVMGRYFLSTAEQDYLMEGIGLDTTLHKNKHVLTLEGVRKTEFYSLTDWILRLLSEKYFPADIEFTVDFTVPGNGKRSSDDVDFNMTLVQCRQLTGSHEQDIHTIPTNVPEENIIAQVNRGVINGYVPNIEYIVYVDPDKYYGLDETKMFTVARIIGLVNQGLIKSRYILIGPGRWGSSTPYYGIKVTFSEIYHTLALVEVTKLLSDDTFTEPSVGSHFGNDVREGSIITMSIYPDTEGALFRKEVFENTPNLLDEYLKGISREDWVKEVVHVSDTKSLGSVNLDRSKQVLHIVSNAEERLAVIYIGEKKQAQKIA